MPSWIRRPPGQPDQRWHLEGLLPPTESLLFTACGLQWTASHYDTPERIGDPTRVPLEQRCQACAGIYLRLTEL